MNDQDLTNEAATISNIEYRLEIIEAKLGITNVYMDLEKARAILNNKESEV